MNYKRIGVLYGGWSNEREVSLKSGRAVASGLRRAGYDTVEIDVGKDLDRQIREARIEAAYIALHGRHGEDGTVQGLLEMMEIPYTGSSVTASALAMDKQLTRTLLAAAGLPIAPGAVIDREAAETRPDGLALPLVVKPIADGSSVGVSIARSEAALAAGLAAALDSSERALVEAYVEGAEIQVAVLDGAVLGAVEIAPHREFYDYEAKYKPGGADHHIPPRVHDHVTQTCCRLAERAYRAIGCSGLARIDIIAPADASPIILEINTSPGMTELSLAPEIAAHAGIPFDFLVARIIESARLHCR